MYLCIRGKKKMSKTNMQLQPIGYARVDEEKGIFEVQIEEKFRPALKEFDKFTHVNILWWAHENDNPEKRETTQIEEFPFFYGKETPTMGVFATRSEYRPNPIALSPSQILHIDAKEGIIKLPYLDAYDGTPIIDLKPYLPMSDLIKSADYPEYLQHWPRSSEETMEWWAKQAEEHNH